MEGEEVGADLRKDGEGIALQLRIIQNLSDDRIMDRESGQVEWLCFVGGNWRI